MTAQLTSAKATVTITQIVLDIVAGAAIGALGGLFGVGGGIVAIPALVIIFGMSQQTAQGTALVTIVPNVLVGLWNYAKRDKLDPRLATTLAGSAVAFSALFAILATRWDEAFLRRSFALFLVAVAAWMLWRLFGRIGQREPPLAWGWSAVLGAVGGALSGVFGIGGATVAPPILTSLFGVKQTTAQGYALALVAPSSIAALVAYAGANHVDWPAGLPLALGGIVAVPAGVALAHRLPGRTLQFLFVALVIATAFAMVLKDLHR